MRRGRAARREIGSPGRTSPPASDDPMTPDLRTSPPSASRSSVAAMSPGWKPSSCTHGLRRPVTSTTAPRGRARARPGRQREQVHAARRDVLAHLAGPTSNPAARSSSCSSAWMRCTWRRLGCVGSRATRERCWTVSPAWASPGHAEPGDERDLLDDGLRYAMRRVAADRDDNPLHHLHSVTHHLLAPRRPRRRAPCDDPWRAHPRRVWRRLPGRRGDRAAAPRGAGWSRAATS